MLRKLMKHELRASGRIMLPLSLVVLITAVGGNFSVRGLMETDNQILNLLGVLLMAAFVIAIAAVCIMAFLLMLERFYKNLLLDEGYVTMTLPVSVHQLIWSKFLISLFWFIVTAIVVVLACMILAFDMTLVEEIRDGLRQLFSVFEFNLEVAHVIAYVLEFLLLILLGCAGACFQFYAALAVGHSFASHKMLLSVAAYFIMQFALRLISGIAMIAITSSGIDLWLSSWLDNPASLDILLLAMCVLSAAIAAIFYGITHYCLKNRLNLE